jgi:hypothetical protein
MASIEITPDELIVRIHGWSRELAMRGALRIPMSHVRAARVRRAAHDDDVVVESWRGWGAHVPYKIASGSLDLTGGQVPAAGGAEDRVIAVDVDHENVRHLVIAIDNEDPENAVRRIEEAIGARRRKRDRAP